MRSYTVCHQRISLTLNNLVFCFSKLTYSNTEKNTSSSYFTVPYGNIGQQLRFYVSGKQKKSLQRVAKHSNKINKFNKMSDPWQSMFNHVSFGGQFGIPSGNDNSEWGIRLSESEKTSLAENRETFVIPPDFRVWEEVQKRNEGNTFKFKILSYNVLAQYLLEEHQYLYKKCSSNNLQWRVRAARLYDEIVNLSPDILCLQEVQADHIESFYSKFEHMGYSGIFKQKTGHRIDGCAIYYKNSVFEMKDYLSVEYYQPELPLLNRDNIGLIVKLVAKNFPVSPIVVATTHLLYNPSRTDVRLAQMQVLLAELDRFAFINDGPEKAHLPIILAGDFNSNPDSAVIDLVEKGYSLARAIPPRDTSDWSRVGITDNCQHLAVMLNREHGLPTDFTLTKIHNSDYRQTVPQSSGLSPTHAYGNLFNGGLITHSLNFESTYAKYKQDGLQEATTFQNYWVTVDYIYFSYHSKLRLLERLRLPSSTECDILGNLPNDVYGSDHLMLAAIFELNPCKCSL